MVDERHTGGAELGLVCACLGRRSGRLFLVSHFRDSLCVMGVGVCVRAGGVRSSDEDPFVARMLVVVSFLDVICVLVAVGACGACPCASCEKVGRAVTETLVTEQRDALSSGHVNLHSICCTQRSDDQAGLLGT